MPSVVRIGSHQPSEILGAAGYLVPKAPSFRHVKTRAEAEAIAQAAHYPPIGRRGLAATTHAGGHSFSNLKEHLRSARENAMIAVQIEDPEAIEHVEEIASVPTSTAFSLAPAISRLD
jgi:4-hydroxy-2-oxoheptanedioate aldolase